MIKIFARFQAKYTHKWTSAVDDDAVYQLAITDWQEELAELTDEQIMLGLANLPKSWPPTSGEFRDLCEEKTDDWEHRTAAYSAFDKSRAIELKADPENVKDERLKARKLVGLV